MLDRVIVNHQKRAILRKIKRAKRLIEKNRISKAEKKYKHLLGDYKAFCIRATYLEKISIYHALLELYGLLRKTRPSEEKPAAFRAKSRRIEIKKARKAKAERAGKAKGKETMKKTAKRNIKEKAAGKEEKTEEKVAPEEKKPAQETKPAPEQKSEPKPERAMKLSTVLDDLYFYINEKGNVNLSDAALRFKVAKSKIEEWAKILEDHSLIKIYYPAFTSPQLTSLGWDEKKRAKEEKKLGRKEEAKA